MAHHQTSPAIDPEILHALETAYELRHISEVSHAVRSQVGAGVWKVLEVALIKARGGQASIPDTPPAEHTPTPWTCRVPPEPVPNVAFWIDGPDGVPIADIKNHASGRTEADARLFTAAPHLLAELKEAVDIFRSLQTTDGVNGGDLVEAMQDWIERRAVPVIIRATGRTA